MNHGTLCPALPTRRRSARAIGLAVVALSTAFMLGLAPAAQAAVLPATPATFGAVFAAAQGGDVVALASGDYGRFAGGQKPATVTVRPQPGAAVTMSVGFSSASNIRVEGVTMTGADITGSSNNVTIAGSRFTGSANVNTSSMVNANVVFDGDTFAGIDVCSNCGEGRLQVSGNGPGPSGVIIQHSVFGPGGNADGIQTNANGAQILNNEFVGIKQAGAVHTDSVQLYGQRNTVIRGNWFHDSDVAIMAPDGGDHEVITDNVFIGSGYRPAVQLGSHNATTFSHNTVSGIDVFMDKKSDSPTPSANGVVRDNVMVNGSIHVSPATCTACDNSYNLFSSSSNASGANALVGMPAFIGGASPPTYATFALAAGSLGKGSASDGTDRGARFTVPTTTPAPVPAAKRASSVKRPSLKLRLLRQMTWAQLRRGVRVHVTAKERVRVTMTLLRPGAKRSLATMTRRIPRAGTRTYRLKPKRARMGRRHAQTISLRVTVTNQAGGKRIRVAHIRVRR